MWSRQADRFPVREVQLQNETKYVTSDVVVDRVKGHLNKGFFWLDVDEIQKSILTLPWISEAGIKRVWPDRIVVEVKEHMPQARWNETGVLSTEGHIFYPEATAILEKLPKFSGQDSRAKEILQHYFSVLEQLGPVGLTVRAVEVSPTGAWQIMLDNEIAIILGKTGINERLARFVEVYQTRLKTQIERIAYVDLRYTNGIAIGWKQGEQPSNGGLE
jgi:cell division protein FtsQ